MSDNSLTPEQQEDYIRRYNENLPFIVQQANYFARKYCQYDKVEDFIQEGCVALINAVRGFDASKGVPFLSYFMYWIHLRMKTFCIANMYCIRVPDRQIKKYEQYKEMKSMGMSDDDIASELNVNVDSLLETINHIQEARTINFSALEDSHLNDKNNSSNCLERTRIDDFFVANSDQMSLENKVCDKITREEYEQIFETVLDEYEQNLIKRHFGFEGSPTSLNKLRYEMPRNGKIVSRERLRQKKNRALEKIRIFLEKRNANQ